MARRAIAVLALAAFACKDDKPQGVPLVRKITAEAELIAGREAGGRIGDYLLSNGRVQLIVQDAGTASGWGLYGGSLVDLARADGPADDRLQEVFAQCELRAFEPTRAEIVNDGRDGRPAILRFTGQDRGIPLIDAAFATQSLGLELTLDYVLAPDSDTLELVLRARSIVPSGSRELSCGLVVLRGDGYAGFTEGAGFGAPAGGELGWLAAAAPDSNASWVLWSSDGPLAQQLPQNEVTPLTIGPRTLPGGGTLEARFFVGLGRGDVESALAERRRVLADVGTALSPVRFEVATPAGIGLDPTQVEIVVSADGRAVTSVRLGADGAATAELPAGAYHAALRFQGRDAGGADFIAGAGVEVAMVLAAHGVLAIETVRTDRDGAVLGPTAAKLVLIRGHGAPPDGERALERYVAPADEVIVEAGDYTAYVSRGPEYELHREDVTIAPASRAALHARVAHVVRTEGWISADLHVHCTKSVDAGADRRARVLGAIAEGVDLLVSTDHDIVTDYTPTIRALGLESMLRTINGIEVSPAYGHMNAMPLAVETPEAYWRVQWYRYRDGLFERVLEPAELVRELRATPGIEYVQINHPRSGQGIFNYVRFDAATGMSAREMPAADGLELLNSRGGGDFDAVLADLLALLKSNRRMTAAGVSDAHEVSDLVGYARTMIRTTEDDATKADTSALFRALREGRAVVLSGPMVTLEARRGAQRAEIGETLTSTAGARIELAVRVEAPTWMDVASFRILEDGELLYEGPLGEADRDPNNPVVRLDRTFTATPNADAFYLVIVEGAPGTTNAPVIGARARSVTNPVFIDIE